MLLRNCAGGVVFSSNNKVFLLQMKKENGDSRKELLRTENCKVVALRRVLKEGGINATIISAGRTNYEFFQ